MASEAIKIWLVVNAFGKVWSNMLLWTIEDTWIQISCVAVSEYVCQFPVSVWMLGGGGYLVAMMMGPCGVLTSTAMSCYVHCFHCVQCSVRLREPRHHFIHPCGCFGMLCMCIFISVAESWLIMRIKCGSYLFYVLQSHAMSCPVYTQGYIKLSFFILGVSFRVSHFIPPGIKWARLEILRVTIVLLHC